MPLETKTPSDAFIFLSKYYRKNIPQEPKMKDPKNEIWTKWPSSQKHHIRFDTGDMSSLTPLNEAIGSKNKNDTVMLPESQMGHVANDSTSLAFTNNRPAIYPQVNLEYYVMTCNRNNKHCDSDIEVRSTGIGMGFPDSFFEWASKAFSADTSGDDTTIRKLIRSGI